MSFVAHCFLIHLLVTPGLQNNVDKMTALCPSSGLNCSYALSSPSVCPSLLLSSAVRSRHRRRSLQRSLALRITAGTFTCPHVDGAPTRVRWRWLSLLAELWVPCRRTLASESPTFHWWSLSFVKNSSTSWFYLFIYFLATLCGTWDLTSLTGDWTWAPCMASSES